MAVKRKRSAALLDEFPKQNPVTANGKFMSALAAARLKATNQTSDDEQGQDVSLEVSPAKPEQNATVLPESDDKSESEYRVEPISTNYKLCTWRNISSNIIVDTSTEFTIILDKHVTVSFLGCYDVRVLRGAVNINGANLGAATRKGDKVEAYRVFVPSTHPVTKVRGLDRTSHVQFLSNKEPTPFAKISPLFAGIWACKRKQGRSFDFLQESEADPLSRPLTAETAPEDWLQAVEEISRSASNVTLITGPSCSGKSTFAKRLLNRYLTGFGKTAKAVPHVAYLDIDPTKPEYTPPGQISLSIIRNLNLGPSFTHPANVRGVQATNETIDALPFPTHDLVDYEEYLISCVSSLIDTYRNKQRSFQTLPLIINTPPSLYANHFHLLDSILATTKPDHVVHLGTLNLIDTDAAARLHSLSTTVSRTRGTLHELSAQATVQPPPRTDAELQAMHMQSYFHLSSQPAPIATAKTKLTAPIWSPQPLTSLPPWQLSYTASPTRTQDFHAFISLCSPICPSSLSTFLTGHIIHVVSTTDPACTSSTSTSAVQRTPHKNLPYLPPSLHTHLPLLLNPASTTLLCTALLHSIDPTTQIINLLIPPTHDHILESLVSPSSPDSPPATILLIAGAVDAPTWAYMEDAYARVAEAREAMDEVVGKDMGRGGRRVEEEAVMEAVVEYGLGMWVERENVVQGMGYLGVGRRVRKFLE